MGAVTSLFQISKDFALLIASTFGFCAAILFRFLSGMVHILHYALITQTYLLLYTFVWSPIFIIFSNIFQLIFLPINIPLKLFTGTSVQNVLVKANTWTSRYIIITISQYALVLIVFGVAIGLICGVCLGIVHSLMQIPDINVDIPILFWKHIPTLWKRFGLQSFPNTSQNSLLFNEERLNIPTPSPSIPPSGIMEPLFADASATANTMNRKKSWQRRSTSSKESVLEMASKLPSDFFQQKNTVAEDFKGQETQQYYQTPGQSPQNVTRDDSSYVSTDIWDQFDELPSTLRTDGGLSTLYSRRPFIATSKGETAYMAKMKNKS